MDDVARVYYRLALEKYYDCARTLVQYFPFIIPAKDVVCIVPIGDLIRALMKCDDDGGDISIYDNALSNSVERLAMVISTALVRAREYCRPEMLQAINDSQSYFDHYLKLFEKNKEKNFSEVSREDWNDLKDMEFDLKVPPNLKTQKINKTALKFIVKEDGLFLFYMSFLSYRHKIFSFESMTVLQQFVDYCLTYANPDNFLQLLQTFRDQYQEFSNKIKNQDNFFQDKATLQDVLFARQAARYLKSSKELSGFAMDMAREQFLAAMQEQEHSFLAGLSDPIMVLTWGEGQEKVTLHLENSVFDMCQREYHERTSALHNQYPDYFEVRRYVFERVVYLLSTSSTVQLGKLYLKLLSKIINDYDGIYLLDRWDLFISKYFPQLISTKPIEILMDDCRSGGPLVFYSAAHVVTSLFKPSTKTVCRMGAKLNLPEQKVAFYGIPLMNFGIGLLEHFCFAWLKFGVNAQTIPSDASTHFLGRLLSWCVDTMKNNRNAMYVISSYLLSRSILFGVEKTRQFLWRDNISTASKLEQMYRQFVPLVFEKAFQKLWGDYFPELFDWAFNEIPDRETLLKDPHVCKEYPRACKKEICVSFPGKGSIRKQWGQAALHGVHPDKGGSGESMLELNEKYRQAKELKIENQSCRKSWMSCTIL